MRRSRRVPLVLLASLATTLLGCDGVADGFHVRGACIAADGSALGGVGLTLIDPDSEQSLATATSSADGTFGLRIDDATALTRARPYGDVIVRAERDDCSRRERLARAGADGVVLSLPRVSALSVIAVDADGDPVEAARATALAVSSRTYYRRTESTDADGRVTFPDAGYDVRLVRVEHAAFHAATFELQQRQDQRVTLQRLPMRSVRGHVLDVHGRPLPGATVYGGTGVRATTDARGAFTFDVLARSVSLGAAGTRSGVGFVAAGKAGHLHGIAAIDGDEPLEIRLRAAEPVRARLLDETGAPLRHARVYLKSGHGALLGNWVPGEPLSTRPDQRGRVEFAAPLPGPTSLEIQRPGRASLSVPVQEPDGQSEWVVRMPAEPLVSGRVLRGADPVCGARVEAVGDGTTGMTGQARLSALQSLAHTFTDARGRYVLALPEGTRAVQAFADDQRSAGLRVERGSRGAPVELDDLRLATEHPIEGDVRDDRGQPVSTGTVECAALADPAVSSDAMLRPDGTFGLPDSAPQAFRLRFRGDGHAAGLVRAWPGDPTRIVVSRLRGEASVEVRLEPAPESATIEVVNVRFPEVARSLTPNGARAMASGLPFGTYRITVRAIDRDPSHAMVVLPPGETASRCEIAVPPPRDRAAGPTPPRTPLAAPVRR